MPAPWWPTLSPDAASCPERPYAAPCPAENGSLLPGLSSSAASSTAEYRRVVPRRGPIANVCGTGANAVARLVTELFLLLQVAGTGTAADICSIRNTHAQR